MNVANAIEVEDLRRAFTRRAPRTLTRMFSRQRPRGGSNANGTGCGDSGKRPAALVAVDGITFDIRAGEIFGLLGPNGAGKTTTIKMLCTLLEPTSGTARVAGFDIAREPARVRASLGTALSGERSC